MTTFTQYPHSKSPSVLGRALARYQWLLAVLFCCLPFTSQASHNVGADITYQCLGNNQYVITLNYYRDCFGIGAPTSISFNVASPSNCGATSTVTANQAAGSGREVSQLCAAQLPQSTCNGGSLPGVQVYTYVATITLPSQCADWTVSYSDCCRNAGITNLANPGAGIYVQTIINNTNGLCNSSPIFTTLPVPYICANQPFSFNHGAVDVDGDSLVFTIIEPRDFGNAILNYGAGFSTTTPMNTVPAGTFGFNSATGQMTFTPAGSQLAVLAVLVTEYRNGVQIGQTMRDIQIVVLNNCTNLASTPNNTPVVASGGSFDPATTSFVVCAGQQLIFSFGVRDPNPLDTLNIYPNNTNLLQVFGAGNFQIVPVYPIANRFDTMDVYVIINANPNNLGANQFTIGLTDNACPVPSLPVLGFNVIIPGVAVTASDTTICPGIAQDIILTANAFSSAQSAVPGTYLWQQISGPTAALSNTTQSVVTVGVPSSTTNGDVLTFRVTYTTFPDPLNPTAFCVTDDTVSISTLALPLNVTSNVSDTTLCQNGTATPISFNTSVTGPGIDVVNGVWTWTTTPAGRTADMSATNVPNPTANVAGTPGEQVQYVVQYAYGACVGTDTLGVRFNNGTVQFPANPVTICAGDTVQLMTMLSDTNIINLPVVCTDYQVTAIPHAPLSGGTPISVALTDDALTGALPIGFSFPFMCDTFTQFRISSNGFITFDLTTTDNGCCSGEAMPTSLLAFGTNISMVALAWNDLNPGSGGTINYRLLGTAPNRRLVVSYNSVPHFGGGGAPIVGQIVLHETTGIIEIFSTTITNDGSTMTQGIQNRTATVGWTPPGRNGVDWSTANTGFRFSPLIAQIIQPITYSWSPTATLGSTTSSQTVTAFPTTNTTYTATIFEGTCAMSSTVDVVIATSLPAPVITCGNPAQPAFEAQFNWGGVAGATGWEYSLDSGRTYITLPLADSTFTVTGLQPNTCVLIYVRAAGGVGPCTRNAAASFECCTFACNPNTSLDEVVAPSTSCPIDNGSISVSNIQNLNGPYTYRWSVPGQTTSTVTGLMAGTYFLTVTGGDGCTHLDTFVVGGTTVFIGGFALTNPSCGSNNGAINVSANGGAQPYSYVWSSNAGGQTGATITGLAPGVYSVTATDANGCRANGTAFINGNQVEVSITSGSATVCFGEAGFIDATATTNGPGTIGYLWSNGTTTQDLSNAGAGVYTLTATVQSGTVTCAATTSFTITAPSSALTAPIQITTPLDCSGEPIGVLAANASGSFGAPFSYLWSNGSTSASPSDLAGGVYSVTVTDAEGCTQVETVTLTQPVAVKLNAFIVLAGQSAATVLENTPNIPIGAGFNEPGISYTWTPPTDIADPNAANTTVNATVGGVYTYVVTAASADCQLSDTVQLTVLATSFLGMPTAFTPNGDGDNDFYRPVEASGIQIIQFRIYNRWGQLVYDNTDPAQLGWDGTVNGVDQVRDTYMYVFEYQIPTESETRLIRGEFTLIR